MKERVGLKTAEEKTGNQSPHTKAAQNVK